MKTSTEWNTSYCNVKIIGTTEFIVTYDAVVITV